MRSLSNSPWMRARALERVGHAHGPDQVTDLQRNPRSPAAPPRFPTPKRSKTSTVPANHALRPDDGQRVYNSGNEATQPNEHQSVESSESKSLRGGAPQHVDLLPQNQISASSRTLEQNKLVGADRSNVKTSTIEPEHHPIRPDSQPYRVSDKDRSRADVPRARLQDQLYNPLHRRPGRSIS